MAKKLGKRHRCRGVLSIRFNNEERSISLGPGSVISDEEYNDLMKSGLATPDIFEDVIGDAAVSEE